MVIKPEQERVRTLLSDTITLLCKNGLSYKSKFCISAVIGITLDEDDVFLVDIRETIKNAEDNNSDSSDNEREQSIVSQKHRRRKRRKSSESGANDDDNDGAFSRLSDGEVDSENGSPAKRANVKQEVDDDDSQDLVFIKDEPSSSDPACSFNLASNHSYNPQQQQGDILGSLAEQGQLYATPSSDQQLAGSWDTGQGGANFAQPSSSQGALGTHGAGLQQQQINLTPPSNAHLIKKRHARPGAGPGYICDSCGKECSESRFLIAHLITHHGRKDLMAHCPICGRAFTREDNMKIHIKRVHHSQSIL